MLLDDYEGYCKRAKLMTGIHAGRKPTVFEESARETTELEGPMGISFLDSLGPSESLFSAVPSTSASSSRTGPSSASASTSSRPMVYSPSSPKRAASPEGSSSGPPTSPAVTPLLPSVTPLSPSPTPVGLPIPPLRSSAQSNGAPRLSPAPSGSNEKEPISTANGAKKDGSKSKDGKDGAKVPGGSSGKAVKRPASAVSGGVKEKGNGAEKRKKGLKRL